MSKQTDTITALFLDIGGVLLTSGWGHEARQSAAREFDLDPDSRKQLGAASLAA